ncbi:hypothetical protein ACFQ3Z_44835 [Streptomyces nogalater]
MNTPPAPIDTRDQHITDLRAALQRAISCLASPPDGRWPPTPGRPVCCWRPPTT